MIYGLAFSWRRASARAVKVSIICSQLSSKSNSCLELSQAAVRSGECEALSVPASDTTVVVTNPGSETLPNSASLTSFEERFELYKCVCDCRPKSRCGRADRGTQRVRNVAPLADSKAALHGDFLSVFANSFNVGTTNWVVHPTNALKRPVNSSGSAPTLQVMPPSVSMVSN